VKSLFRFVVLSSLFAVAPSARAEAARVFVVHGIPGVTVDIYASPAGGAIPTVPTVPGFTPKTVADLPSVTGTFDIRIYAQGANPQVAAPVIQALGVSLPAAGEFSIVAHLTEAGTPTATVFRNDNSAVQGGWARVSVRHTAAAPAVQLLAGGVPKLALVNNLFGDLEVPATTIPLQITLAFSTTPITPVAPLAFASGTRYFVYPIGSASDGTLDFIIHTAR
jgi:hypothetical protein